MTVVSFVGYTPPPRYDLVPWIEIVVEEGATSNGPWTQIDVIALDPVDPDPENPLPRSFTTTEATLEVGWYRLTFRDAQANGSTLSPVRYDNVPVNAAVPTAEEIRRRTPNIEWAEMGYAEPDDPGEPDSLDPLIVEATAELYSLIGIDATTVDVDTDKRLPLISRAIRMLVTYNAGASSQEVLDTVVDFDLIQSMGASVYNETRRAISANRTVIHPWPALNKLLLGILFWDAAGRAVAGNGPGISTDNLGNPPPGEWYMDPHKTKRLPVPEGPFAAPPTLPRHYF